MNPFKKDLFGDGKPTIDAYVMYALTTDASNDRKSDFYDGDPRDAHLVYKPFNRITQKPKILLFIRDEAKEHGISVSGLIKYVYERWQQQKVYGLQQEDILF